VTYGTIPECWSRIVDLPAPFDTWWARQALRDAGLSGKLARLRLDTFLVDRQPAAYEQTQRWLEATLLRHHPPDGGWLYLSGDNGLGKTHLAVACLALLAVYPGYSQARVPYGDGARGPPGLFLDWAIASAGYQALQQRFDDIVATPFLVLDDLTKRRPTVWSLEALFSIVNSRDYADLTTIVTANVPLPDLGRHWARHAADADRDLVTAAAKAIVDRLAMRLSAGGTVRWHVALEGHSYRLPSA
jgi:DNA replication protein DnaC